MSLFNEYEFKKCVDRYKGDGHSVKYKYRDQFIVMSIAQFTNRACLRDIETTLKLSGDLLQRAEIRELNNQRTVPVVVPEAGYIKQLTLRKNISGQQ